MTLRVSNMIGFASQGQNRLPPGLSIWARYKASTMHSVGDGNAVAQWDDISGNARHLTQGTSTRRPLYRANASGLSGNKAAIEFLGDDTNPHNMAVPNMSALTQGFIATFVITDTDTNGSAANIRRIWEMGTSTDGYYKYTTGGIEGIYETFGTTARKTSGDPAAGALSQWHSYMVASASGAWTNYLNNVQHFTTGTNTVGFPAAPAIGGYPAGTTTTRLANKKYAEIIILSVVPTADQRAGIQTYFTNEYL